MSQFTKNTSVSEKKYQKVHNLQDKAGCQKFKVSVTAKVNASKYFNIDIHKIQKLPLSKANYHFLVIFMSICMEKYQNGTCIFLLKISLLK